MTGFMVSEQIFSDKFKVATFFAKMKVLGWIAAIELCCKLRSSKFICCWNKSACSSLNSLFLKFRTFKSASFLNEFSSIFRNRFPDKSKFVNFDVLPKSSGEKFVSLLSSIWRIRRHFKFIIACGWITKILLPLRFNSSKLDWCWNIRTQTMPILFSFTERNFRHLRGLKVSQCRSLIWLWARLSFSKFPGPMKVSLSTCSSRLFSIITSFNTRDFRNSLAGRAVSWLLLKLAYLSTGKFDKTSDESCLNPAFSKLTIVKHWNLWIISLGMVLNLSCLVCKYLMFSSRMFFVLTTTLSVPSDILHESPYFAWA